MRQFSIERSLHILGPVLGKKRGVEVRIGGGQACTDGNTIWLPALPIDDAEAAVLGFGLLFHETNHVRYTDFAVAKGEGLVGRADQCARRHPHRWTRPPGISPVAGERKSSLVEALIRRGEAKSCTKDDHPARILESYVMWRLEYDVLGIDAAKGMAEQRGANFPGDVYAWRADQARRPDVRGSPAAARRSRCRRWREPSRRCSTRRRAPRKSRTRKSNKDQAEQQPGEAAKPAAAGA